MSLILSSPAKHTRNSAGKFSAIDTPPVKQLCDDMDNEMRRCFIGPMSVKEFFRKFLPAQELSENDRAALPGFEAIAKVKKESEMYDKFVRLFFHRPFCFTPRPSLSLGLHHKLILFQDQSVQLIKGSGY
jgi:hypothetical protein